MSTSDTEDTQVSIPEPKGIAPRPKAVNGSQKRYLRAQGHRLKPLVFIGRGGITDGVIDAVKDALDRHELIKISVPADGARNRNEMGRILSTMTGSHVAQTIGRVVLLFRQKGTDSQFKLPQQNKA